MVKVYRLINNTTSPHTHSTSHRSSKLVPGSGECLFRSPSTEITLRRELKGP